MTGLNKLPPTAWTLAAPRPLKGTFRNFVRGAVERFFAWISRNRRLWNGAEVTIESATVFLYAAAVMILVRRIARHQ